MLNLGLFGSLDIEIQVDLRLLSGGCCLELLIHLWRSLKRGREESLLGCLEHDHAHEIVVSNTLSMASQQM